MKKILIYGMSLFMGLNLLFGCYDDKGSYDYTDINEITIDLPATTSVRLPLKDSVLLTLTPGIKQSQEEGEDNLTFLWKKRVTYKTGFEWVPFSDGKEGALWIKSSDVEQQRIRLIVKDKNKDVEFYHQMTIVPVKPFNRCWFVLQDVNGTAVLGAVDGEGETAVVIKEVYTQTTGKVLSGKPRFLYANVDHPAGFYAMYTDQVLVLCTDKEGFMLDGNTLLPRYTYNELLLNKKILGQADYDPMYTIGSRQGEAMIDDGVFWYGFPDSYSVFYPVKLDVLAGDSYKATMSMGVNNYVHIVFDDAHKRFLRYKGKDSGVTYNTHGSIRRGNLSYYNPEGSINSPKLQLIGERTEYPNAFNPDAIGSDKRILYMGATTDSRASKSIAIAYGENDQQLHIYEFNSVGLASGSAANCSGYFTFRPEGTVESLHCATSSSYDRMFFYASGNKIYKVDLNRKIPMAFSVYEHPDPSVKITNLKFRHDRLWWMVLSYGDYLGAVVDYGGGKSGLLDMQLNAGGNIVKEDGKELIVEYKGFENIVDFSYMAK